MTQLFRLEPLTDHDICNRQIKFNGGFDSPHPGPLPSIRWSGEGATLPASLEIHAVERVAGHLGGRIMESRALRAYPGLKDLNQVGVPGMR